MASEPEEHDLGGTEGVVKYVKEQSDNIAKAVLYPPGAPITLDGGQVAGPYAQFALVLHFTTTTQIVLGEDAEAVLNDGVLSRAGIRLEFGSGK